MKVHGCWCGSKTDFHEQLRENGNVFLQSYFKKKKRLEKSVIDVILKRKGHVI